MSDTKLNTDFKKVNYTITQVDNPYVSVNGFAYKISDIHIIVLDINIRNQVPGWSSTLCAKINNWDGSGGRILADSLGGTNPAFYVTIETNGNMSMTCHDSITIAGWAYANGVF